MSKSIKADGSIPRSRLEALTDGVFAFAMTLLVINIELPQDLLGVTFLPFSMLAVSRYDLAAAVWIYAANMIWLAVTALAVSRAAERDSGRESAPDGRIKLGVLIAAAALSVLASLYSPDYAMLLYLLVLAAPLVTRVVRG